MGLYFFFNEFFDFFYLLTNDPIPSKGFNFFSDLSIWDIFRTEYPLLVLLQPQVCFIILTCAYNYYISHYRSNNQKTIQVSRDVVISMLKMSEQSPNPDSSLPKWAFIGGDTGSMEVGGREGGRVEWFYILFCFCY